MKRWVPVQVVVGIPQPVVPHRVVGAFRLDGEQHLHGILHAVEVVEGACQQALQRVVDVLFRKVVDGIDDFLMLVFVVPAFQGTE